MQNDSKDLEQQESNDSKQNQKINPELAQSLGGTVEKNVPEDVVWIDDAFYVKKTRFGLHTSILKNPFGAHFITGMHYEDVVKVNIVLPLSSATLYNPGLT